MTYATCNCGPAVKFSTLHRHVAYMTMASDMAMASSMASCLYCKRLLPCIRKEFGHTRLDFLFTDTVEDHEFLDTPVHGHIHVVTMHKWKTIKRVLITLVQQIMVLLM